jgi:hypothetical protein
MDRRRWDWQKLVQSLPEILEKELPATATAIDDEVHVRIRSRDRRITEARAWHTRAFSLVQGEWFERHAESVRAKPSTIVDHDQTLHQQPDTWVIVHVTRDLSADQVHTKSPEDLAAMLMQFNDLRRRLRTVNKNEEGAK